MIGFDGNGSPTAERAVVARFQDKLKSSDAVLSVDGDGVYVMELTNPPDVFRVHGRGVAENFLRQLGYTEVR